MPLGSLLLLESGSSAHEPREGRASIVGLLKRGEHQSSFAWLHSQGGGLSAHRLDQHVSARYWSRERLGGYVLEPTIAVSTRPSCGDVALRSQLMTNGASVNSLTRTAMSPSYLPPAGLLEPC